MGLLDDMPDGLLGLLRNGAQNRFSSADPIAGDANDLPSWARSQQQRLPFSFAGPGLFADIPASSPSRVGTTVPPARSEYSPAGSGDADGALGNYHAGVRSASTLNMDPRNTAIGGSYFPKQNFDQSSQQAGITSDKSAYCRAMANICIQECHGVRSGFDTFGPFRACMRTCMHNAGCLDF